MRNDEISRARSLLIGGIIGVFVFFPLGVVLLFLAAKNYEQIDKKVSNRIKVFAWIVLCLFAAPALFFIFLLFGGGFLFL